MGRELKMVPLDFDWPVKIIWRGYVNPYREIKCEPCGGTGRNPETRRLLDTFYGDGDHGDGWGLGLTQDEVDALVASGRLPELTRLPRTDEQRVALEAQRAAGGGYWMKEQNGHRPTAEEVNAWARTSFPGHDGVNQWIALEVRAKRLGVFGRCSLCKGDGQYFTEPRFKRLFDKWRRIEPPAGPGYQLWETTSEGSPVSPVFKTLDELCAWAAGNATTFGSFRTSADEWRKMLSPGGIVAHRAGGAIFL